MAFSSLLTDTVTKLLKATRKELLIVVPLTHYTNGSYGCPVDEQDSTHVIRWTLIDWIRYLQNFDKNFVVTGGYEHPVLKPNCYEYPCSYGFFHLKRINP